MALHTTSDVAEIRRLMSTALAADPVANTVFSSMLSGLDEGNPAGWAAHPAGDPSMLAARTRPDRAVTLTPNWTDVADLAVAMTDIDPPVQAVAAAPAVLDELLEHLDRPPSSRMDERLFRLDELVPPAGVEGAARPATLDDLDLLVDWLRDFGREAFGRALEPDEARQQITQSFGASTCWLWVDGDEVSMAVRHPVFDGVARIGPVYTPPSGRGRGYGSAVTAAAARQILDDGAVPVLYTDLANPTSNKIYQAIGFVPVLDRCMVRFD